MKRRTWLSAATLSPLALAAAPPPSPAGAPDEVSLNGPWEFRLDGDSSYRTVQVPHTWQTEPASAEYLGAAHYRRDFYVPASWTGRAIRVRFDAVYHTAEVSLNGQRIGDHRGKGYTRFTLDLTSRIRFGGENRLEVRVDNSFNDSILPRGNSFDWTADGGIYRPVALLVTPPVYADEVLVHVRPNSLMGSASVSVEVKLAGPGNADIECVVIEESTGRRFGPVRGSGAAGTVMLSGIRIPSPTLWHFDQPHMYLAQLTVNGHRTEIPFGVRRFEIKEGAFFLNNEKVRLFGVERMAGSHPTYGMVEPLSWIEHDHEDMKNLNCVFTRVHWMQDPRLVDWCDRNGMIIQLEVPTWGPNTFRGMPTEPGEALMQNALEQLTEMIRQNHHHPSVCTWGLCNEINGQGEAQKVFVRTLKKEARRLDSTRPLTYASHSLFSNPGGDISSEMDFVSWNQYYGSWQKGWTPELKKNLEEVIQVFPAKPLVISEYGYCACTADRPEGDEHRRRVLQEQDAVFRNHTEIAGLIFFCYNDYRTHMGDKGQGVLKQRVHGVVDVYGNRKPSYELLRQEASPVESVTANGSEITVRARATLPAYTLRGYSVKWTVFGRGDIPLEEGFAQLADIPPGGQATARISVREMDRQRLRLDIMRPTGFSAYTTWI